LYLSSHPQLLLIRKKLKNYSPSKIREIAFFYLIIICMTEQIQEITKETSLPQVLVFVLTPRLSLTPPQTGVICSPPSPP
jgi:hypothetical protein